MSQEIDDSLYSRQRYVLGDNAMKKMASSSVYIYGLDGLGIEIAKNLALAGVKTITVDDPKLTTLADLGSQFYLSNADIGTPRASASLAKLRELNPYVSIILSESSLSHGNLKVIGTSNVAIFVNLPMDLQQAANLYCRTKGIKFISCQMYGLCSSLFCDFGDCFAIEDADGEEGKEIFIGNICNDTGTVSTFNETFHELQLGDLVTFTEVNGMSALNGMVKSVVPLSPFSFTIEGTKSLQPYENGGIIKRLKRRREMVFNSLDKETTNPSLVIVDLSNLEAPLNTHIAMLGLDSFVANKRTLPSSSDDDVKKFIGYCHYHNELMSEPLLNVDDSFLKTVALSCKGYLQPLAAAFGGIAAQEALIAITGKFSPIQQWLCLQFTNLIEGDADPADFEPVFDRYDNLRQCLGSPMVHKVFSQNMFMVGCGAIGCEMLKNFSLLGFGVNGCITITDDDVIEKSNLNRQFLFRSADIRQPKSVVAAQAIKSINADVTLRAEKYRVSHETEISVFDDEFFAGIDLVVNALDNVQARRYMDIRCVANRKPLVDSGTLGTKGHVQIVVPHLTESYGSQLDPTEEISIAYCTLKSFPATIDHTIEWARDRFEKKFVQQPELCTKFWSTNNNCPEFASKYLESGNICQGFRLASKLYSKRPSDWRDCITLSRIDFEKCFNQKAKQLLHSFPIDTQLSDGSLFWTLPKRPPTPLLFDQTNDIHMSFLISNATLLSNIYNLHFEDDEKEIPSSEFLAKIDVPEFAPSSKVIEIDESKPAPNSSMVNDDKVYIDEAISKFTNGCSTDVSMTALVFEKDDDRNSHIDYIASSANLRAAMYGIQPVDRLQVKRIAGRIVPAIATTTSAVSGFATIELLKVVRGVHDLELFRNTFLNLAIPAILMSEPAAAPKKLLPPNCVFTLWDRWDYPATGLLSDLMGQIKADHGLDTTSVFHGTRMVYVNFMPGHSKRLNKRLVDLVRLPGGVSYVDLMFTFENIDSQYDDFVGPTVRLQFS